MRCHRPAVQAAPVLAAWPPCRAPRPSDGR